MQSATSGAPASVARGLRTSGVCSSSGSGAPGGGDAPGATSADADPWVARLASRSVICMEGADSLAFLQGMVTNDMRPLASPGAPPVYAALVNPKGKLLHDLFVFRGDAPPGDTAAAGDAGEAPAQRLWLDVDAAGAADLLQWLSRYRLRRAVRLEAAGGDAAVWARRGPDESSSGSGSSSSSGGGWWADPRLPGGALGERGVFEGPGPAAAAGGGGGWRLAGDAAHRLLRYRLGVAEGDGEMPAERTTPLELNLDALNGVSYTKGCYIGQERNSYTHFRGIVRRRVMPVELPPQPPPRPGAPLFDAASGAQAGVLLAAEGGAGLAHVKLASALAAAAPGAPPLRAGAAGEEGGWARPVRPGWWPEGWGREDGEGAAPAGAAPAGAPN